MIKNQRRDAVNVHEEWDLHGSKQTHYSFWKIFPCLLQFGVWSRRAEKLISRNRGNPFTLSGISHTILGLSHPWDAKFRGISWINESHFLASTGCLREGAESLQGQLWPPNRAKEYQGKKYENTTRDRMTVVLPGHITWGWFINSWGLWQKNPNVWFSCFGMEASLPCRYISSPSVNIWLHLLHRAQLGW